MPIDKSRTSVPELEYEAYANGIDLGRLLEKHHFGTPEDYDASILP